MDTRIFLVLYRYAVEFSTLKHLPGKVKKRLRLLDERKATVLKRHAATFIA